MAEPRGKQRVREGPRITLNSLSEYLTASATRRQGILREQKRPSDFRVVYYREVEEAIAASLAEDDEAPLRRCRMAIANLDRPDYERTRRANGLVALDTFEKIVSALPLDGLERQRGPSRPRRLSVEGVPVSVRPEVLLRTAGGPAKVGAIKLYFSSTKALSKDRANFAGAILWRYVAGLVKEEEKADYKICFVVDVFAGKWYRAPRTYKRRIGEAEAACREIRAMWPFV